MTNKNTGDTFEIVPLKPVKTKMAPDDYRGRFINMQMETQAKRDGSLRKDLVLTVQLVNPMSSGQDELAQVFNLLPGKRGASQFKKGMSSWLKRELSDQELAAFKTETLMNKAVICRYAMNKLGNAVVFDTYLPVNE